MPTPGNHSRGNSDRRIRRQRNKRIRREGDKITRAAQITVLNKINDEDQEDSDVLGSLGLIECECYPGSWCLGDATNIDLELLSVQLDVKEMELELQVARLITMP